MFEEEYKVFLVDKLCGFSWLMDQGQGKSSLCKDIDKLFKNF